MGEVESISLIARRRRVTANIEMVLSERSEVFSVLKRDCDVGKNR